MESLQTSLEESLNVGLPLFTSLSLGSLAYYTYNYPLIRLRSASDVGSSIRVGESPGKGMGAFYNGPSPLPKGRLVGQYMGELLTLTELAEKYPPVGGTIAKNDYLFELRPSSLYIDASDPDPDVTNWTRFINHSSKDPNLVVEVNNLHKVVSFDALRDIRPGEEVRRPIGGRVLGEATNIPHALRTTHSCSSITEKNTGRDGRTFLWMSNK